MVIVHWDDPVACERTIEAFAASMVPVRLLVVDNASSPSALDSVERAVAAATAPGEVVSLGTNRGFGAAANVGLRRWLRRHEGEWVAVAPHDAVPETDTLAALVENLEAKPEAGLACADVGDGTIPVLDPYFGGTMVAGGGAVGWEDVDYPHGTLFVGRRACLAEVGLFDERFFAYCEEADLGMRARRAGWGVGLVRGARVHNDSMSATSDVVDYLMQRNTLFLVRWNGGRYRAGVRFVIAVAQLARGIVQPSYSPFLYAAHGRARGLVDFLRGRVGPPPASLTRAATGPPRRRRCRVARARGRSRR